MTLLQAYTPLKADAPLQADASLQADAQKAYVNESMAQLGLLTKLRHEQNIEPEA